MFGAINALFSGFTVVGLIYTIRLQQNEIKNARAEHDEQLRFQNRVKFEGTFFKLMDMAKENLQYIKGEEGFLALAQIQRTRAIGQNAVTELIEKFAHITSGKNTNRRPPFDNGSLYLEFEDLLKKYDAKNYVTNLRNIYVFLSMTDEINTSDRNLFTSIINSNMTEGDRWLLYLSLFEYANNSLASWKFRAT